MKRLALFVISMFLFGYPIHSAQGYAFWTCDGTNPITWGTNEIVLKRIPISFPWGTPQRDALLLIEEKWNRIDGARFNFIDGLDDDNEITFMDTIVGPLEETVIDADVDGNEVGFVAPEDLSRGREAQVQVLFWCGDSNPRIRSVDVLFDHTAPWSFESPPAYGRGNYNYPWDVLYFRTAALHELGHAFGLQHPPGIFAIMNTDGWYPGTGDFRVIPHGDDRFGIQHLYPAEGEEKVDIAVINFKKDPNAGRGNFVRGVSVPGGGRICPGDEFSVEYNFGNPGDLAVEFELAFYLSRDLFFDSSDILLDVDEWYSGTGAASYSAVPEKQFTLPHDFPLEEGAVTYYVLVYADYRNRIDEIREGNNIGAVPGHLTVGRCGFSYRRSCTDSDDGMTLSVRGTVRTTEETEDGSVGGETGIDTCVDDEYIEEFFCDGSRLNSTIRLCPQHRCRNGACVRAPHCARDTDANEAHPDGINPRTPGIVEVVNEDGISSRWIHDECVGPTSVREHYCEGYSEVGEAIVPCVDGEVCGVNCPWGEEVCNIPAQCWRGRSTGPSR